MILQIIGSITPPEPFQTKYGSFDVGLIRFFNNLVRLLIVVGGIWAFLNLVLAGYGFLNAGDDPKKVMAAWQKIYMSMLGVLFILASFVLAAIFSYLLFGNPTFILNPQIYGP